MPEECLPPLFSDEDRLNQIISIFLDNAISYSPEQTSILLEASVKKNNLAISIIDHGKDHYGLGLSVANELVSLLGGKIYLNDTPGGGCTFTIAIPWSIAE